MSYRFNVEGRASGVLTLHGEYRRMGRSAAGRRQAYRALFKASRDSEEVDEIRTATNGNYALGNERFKAKVERKLGRRVTPAKLGRPKRR